MGVRAVCDGVDKLGVGAVRAVKMGVKRRCNKSHNFGFLK